MNEMTCREFDEFVHGFVRMELLDVTLREAVLEHAACCRNCDERMAEATALAEAAEAVGRSMRDQQAPASVETAVLAAFRSHHKRAAWRRTFEWATLGAAAAVLLIFVWTHTGGSKGRLQPSPGRDVSSKSREPLDAKVDANQSATSRQGVGDSAESDRLDGNDRAAGNDTRLDEDTQGAYVEVADTSVSPNFVASDFVPVPYTGGISADDPGMVVRVQLTRASLAQLGYPVADTASDDDLIRADVLVDQDGWPRGVKLAQ
jgi:hypothetical protein